jgi:hypothetical protein
VAERRSALASVLRRLEATTADVAAAKLAVAAKVAALRASDQSWRAAVPPDATAASLHAQADALDAAAAASASAQATAATRGAAARLRLASLAEEREALVAQAAALEARVGANSASAEEDVTDGANEANCKASGKAGKEGKKRSLAVANLVAGNREATDAAEFFAALTGCLEALSGVRVEACEDAADDDAAAGESSGNANVLVRLRLWGRHKLTLTLGPRPGSGGGSAQDVLVAAELETDFDVEEQRLSLGGVQPLATAWLTCVPRGSRAAERAVGVADLLASAQQLGLRHGNGKQGGSGGGQDVQLVVREACARLAAWPERLQHLAAVKAVREPLRFRFDFFASPFSPFFFAEPTVCMYPLIFVCARFK